jgi:hypothetical protein
LNPFSSPQTRDSSGIEFRKIKLAKAGAKERAEEAGME